MNLSEFCIRRPVFTTLLMLAIVVGGVAGYQSLAVSALPRVDFPTIQVTATLPGASPETMAASVATPLERQFSIISGVTAMTSTSFLGYTQITLQFDLNRNIDGAALDVQTNIAATLSKLPPQMTTPPTFQKVNPADQPILFIAVSSDTLPISQVDDYADTLMAERISTLSGVAQVQIYGEQKYAIRVQADPKVLAAHDISFTDMQKAVAAAASSAPVGIISGSKQLFNLKVEGQPQDAASFRPLIVTWRNGAPVRLQDVATVVDSVQDTRSIGNINGKKSVVIAIQRQPDANTIDVVNEVRALLPIFRTQLPAAIELTPLFDRSVSIKNSVDDVQFTLKLTVFLVVLVIFLFLRKVSATLIPAVAVPLSIIATYGGMSLMGFSINNVSLLALTLCVGFVVDDAIVMLENIVRHIEEGMTPFDAALKGSREIGFTIISMTISLVAVFIPVLFMGGIVGRLFREFAVTISMAILVSGFISLTLTPMLCSRFLRPIKHGVPEPVWAQGLERAFMTLHGLYERTLMVVLRHRFITLMVTIAMLFITLFAFTVAPKGFFPLEDTGFIFAYTEAAQDISFDAMVDKQRQAAELIRKDPSVTNVFFAIGGGRSPLNSGRIFFGLKPKSQRPSSMAIIARLREQLKDVQGLNVFMQPVQNISIGGRLSKSLYQYTLQGNDLKDLYHWAAEMEKAVGKEKGFLDVTTDLQIKSLELRLVVDEQKAASFGITYDDVRQVLYSALGTAQAFQDSAAGQGMLLLFAILVIYIILGMLYESFVHPITILSGLPSAGLGAVVTLLLCGMDLSVIAIIGVVLLIGIVKKNAIMMIDFAVGARAGGATAEEAITQACLLRFRPIMMTTMAAIFGTLPIAIGFGDGSELRQPLGIAVVGGLLTSQLLTLYITPVVYLYLERLTSKR